LRDISITIPAVALRGMTILPGMVAHFDVSRERSIKAVEEAMMGEQNIFLVTQRDVEDDDPQIDDLYHIGILAKIKQVIKMQHGIVRILVEGEKRAELLGFVESKPFLLAEVSLLEAEDEEYSTEVKEGMLRAVQETYRRYAALNPKAGKEFLHQVSETKDADKLMDLIVNNLPVYYEEKQKYLEAVTIEERYEVLMELLLSEINIISIKKDFQEKVKQRVDKNQKEYLLREQMKVIREELGEDNTESDADQFLQALKKIKAKKDVKEKIKKSVPEIDEIKFVSIHDFKIADYEDYDIIISTEERKEKDKRIVVIPNILNETGISTLRAHLDNMNSIMIENATPFSPECFILFSPEFIFTDLEVKTKEECLKIMSQAMEEKHVVTEDFYDSVMDCESKTTTTIGNGVSLPHGSPTAVNESKVGIAILKNPIMWDNEQVQVVFLLAFRLSTRDEISRIQMFYKEYVTLIDSEEKLEKLKSMKSNIELYKYLIQ